MSEFIDILSPNALADIEKLNAELVKTLSNVKKVNENLIGAKTPSGSDSAIKDLNNELVKQQKLYADLQIKLERYAQAQNRTKISQNSLEKSTISLSNAKERSAKQTEREALALERANNVYNKVQSKVNSLTATYNNIAIKKELGLKLTDREVAQLTSLESRLNKYQTALKNTDATIGKHQRNVGNYAGSFNGLSNSINQITRELPAFTFSAQTGFLALSNNIPILVDEIDRLKFANKELIAQGKPVKSVFSQILGSLLSFQTAMGVGILLFTLYGKEIGAFVTSLFNAGRSIQTVSDQLNQLSEARERASEMASKEIAELDTLYKTATNVNLSIKERKDAVDKMQELYPFYLANIEDENILNGKAEKQYYKLRDAILAKYQAEAIGEKIAENTKNRLEEYLDVQNDIRKAEDEILRLRKSGNDLVIKGSAQEKVATQTISNNDLILAQERFLLMSKQKLEALKKQASKEDSVLLELQWELLRQSQGLNKAEDERAKSITKTTTAKKENNKEKEKEIELLKGSEAWYEKQISALKQLRSTTADTTEEYKSFDAQLAILEDGLKSLRGELAQLEGEGIKLDFETLGLTAEGFEKWRKKSTDIREDEGENWKDYFNKWSGVALDAINVVQEAQQQSYDRELARLELQRDNAILFAGESESARSEIDRQYDEKRRRLLNRQAKEQKALAITEAIINTASAVIKALPNIPLSVAVGLIGVAQTSLIASQQIPQFYKGTDNAPEGWAWTQEHGAEIITDKSGKIKSLGSDKGSSLTYLNKGDKVYTANETDKIMFNNELNGILSNNGISGTVINNSLNLNPLRSDIKSLERTIKCKKEFHYIKDIHGERVYERENGMKKQMLSKRLRIK